MKEKLTLKKLILATVVCILLDISYVYIRQNYGLNWVSPKTLSFWSKDLALVIGWVIFIMESRKK